VSTATFAAVRSAPRPITRADYDRYLPLVRRVAMRIARRVPSHVGVAELVSYGWLGMVEALSRADASLKPEQFEAYALHRVQGAILDYLRSLDPQKRKLRTASRRVARAIHKLTGQLGRPPEEQEIAAEMGVPLAEYHDLLSGISHAGMARLEMVDLDEADPAGDGELPDEVAGRRLLAAAVAEAIERLPERLRNILSLYYQHDCTLREIGAVLGVTESRVCQLHSEAMHRLRADIGRE
jgi:RNA polymerase sigma factor for flagellar operon FliA